MVLSSTRDPGFLPQRIDYDDLDLPYNTKKEIDCGLSWLFSRLGIACTETDHIEKNAIDVEAFIVLTRRRYRRLILPNFVLNSEDLIRLNVRDIQKTSLTVKKIKLTGPDANISNEARFVLRSFYAVSIKSSTENDFNKIFSTAMPNITGIVFPLSGSILEMITLLSNAAPNLRRATINLTTPLQIQSFRGFSNLLKLELGAAADDELGNGCQHSSIKILIIHDCRHVESFQFLGSFNRLEELTLKKAPHLRNAVLAQVLTNNLKVFCIFGATRMLPDDLFNMFIERQIDLRVFEMPLANHLPATLSLSLKNLQDYATHGLGRGLTQLNLQGHKSIHDRIWVIQPICFPKLKYLNVRDTGARDMRHVVTMSDLLYSHAFPKRVSCLVHCNRLLCRVSSPFLIVEMTGSEGQNRGILKRLNRHNVIRVILHGGDAWV
jgi:hypothetical protein